MDIDFSTNDNLRMRLWGNQGSTINGYSGVTQNGFLGLSARTGFFGTASGVVGPFSRLHLVDNEGAANPIVYAQQLGFRPWMRNGITLTGNSDQGYIGQQYNAADATDMVIQWSDNPETDPWASDRMRFVFTSEPDGSTNGMRSLNGLEAVRLWPADEDNVNVGIGDWLVSGSGDPTERLDVLTGRVRIRQLPSDPTSTQTEYVTVDANGILEHRPLPTTAPDNCEWTMDATSPNHVYTAVGTADPDCPDEVENVGIGTTTPAAKLTVVENTPYTSGTDIAITAVTEGQGGNNYGISTSCNMTSTTAGTLNIGLSSEAKNGTGTIGVAGYATADVAVTTVQGSYSFGAVGASANDVYGSYSLGSSSVSNPFICGAYGLGQSQGGTITASYGVYGRSNENAGTITTGYGVYGHSVAATTNYSIYGDYQTGGSSGTDYSGYFVGDIKVNGVYYPSDDALKINEVPLDGALALLGQLEPLKYDYDTANHPSMHLRTGTQVGLKAQDVEAVLPGLVRNAQQPAEVDELGNVVMPEVDYKAIDYVGLTPVLIGAVQELQAWITDLQDQLNNCCTQGMAPQGEGSGNGIGYIDNTQRTDAPARQLNADELLVSPNPFTENPAISYRIGTGGRAQLRVSSASSRDMGVLLDAGTEAGQYSMVWNTVGMAPGLYLLTLTVDGKRVTERAVKVE